MLTALQIRRLKANSKRKRYADRDGLTLEVRTSGKKVFIYRYQWGKKSQTITIGEYPYISLDQARQIAYRLRMLLLNGTDPRTEFKQEESQTDSIQFIGELWLQKNCHQWRERTQVIHKRSLTRDIYPYIGNIPIDQITKADLLNIIHPHEEKGNFEISHRLHDRLKAIFDFAVAAGLTENYPFIGLKKALAPKPKIKNQSAISPNDAHKMLSDLKAIKSKPVVQLYVEILSHLFVRPSELRLAKWSEFNLQKAEWHIPESRMKMDAPHWVPLSDEVLRLLRQLRLLTGFTPYLFNSPSPNVHKPISETSARKLLDRAGYKGLPLHGFRALASSVLHEQSTFRTDAIEAQLAHKIQGVRGVYLRADFKHERRELMEWYSGWLQINESSEIKTSYNQGK